MKTSKTLLAILLIGMTTLHHANAQEKSIHPVKSFRVEIEKMDSKTEKGILQEIKDSSLIVSTKHRKELLSEEIPYTEIKTISLRRTGRVARGMLIGLVSGVIAGGLIGAAVASKGENSSFTNDLNNQAISMTAGALMGAILGTIIGGASGSTSSDYVINGRYNFYRDQKSEIILLVTSE